MAGFFPVKSVDEMSMRAAVLAVILVLRCSYGWKLYADGGRWMEIQVQFVVLQQTSTLL